MNKPTIRIMDDDEDMCSEVAGAMTAAGYRCSWTTSPGEAIPSGQCHPDILLLDLHMPVADGFQVIQGFAGASRQPHLIIASGFEERIIRAAARSARQVGINVLGSLEKPYSIAALLTLVKRYSAGIDDKIEDHSALIEDLVEHGSLERHLRTAFQSKRQLSDGRIVGYEALLRLTVDGRPIRPEVVFSPFVAMATQLAATRVVLNDALRFGARLRKAGKATTMAVNCTPAILCTPELPDLITAALEKWQMPPSSLLIEITEHETVQSFDAIATAASRLALRHCGIAIDDFGKGATSLERLFDLPLTELKIDKEIFWQCSDGTASSSILKEIVRYCEERDVISTIEGIETIAHLEHATSIGARSGQGYLWDRPKLVF